MAKKISKRDKSGSKTNNAVEVQRGNEGNVVFSYVCKDPSIKLSSRQDKAFSTLQAYKSSRVTHGCYEGTWYFEAYPFYPSKEDLPSTGGGISGIQSALERERGFQPHWRIGWQRKNGELDSVCGINEYGYTLRDSDLSFYHNRRRLQPNYLPPEYAARRKDKLVKYAECSKSRISLSSDAQNDLFLFPLKPSGKWLLNE
ncbi:Histone methyltransferase complex subunit ASH2 like protein [Aduncisulcus paluster]|uniref:Histone methyltransferase complex subunit ASH2 like protein n=1 Tax=Aduncisulcus paluster TaxID=2918883 RepID=A0ABQ5JWV1_9EUKA|nr:Histone methyltransferase complex subunit ASH2 like protein [Aduncisulcus paluster]